LGTLKVVPENPFGVHNSILSSADFAQYRVDQQIIVGKSMANGFKGSLISNMDAEMLRTKLGLCGVFWQLG
jgi:hypothetical protein